MSKKVRNVNLWFLMEETDRTHSKIPIIILGIVLGIALTLGILFAKNYFFDRNKKATTQAKILTLKIDQPNKNLATANKTITISGSTEIASVVSINSGSQTKIIDTPKTTFSQTLDLSEGKNIIQITAYDPITGGSQTETREVLYLNEDLSNL